MQQPHVISATTVMGDHVVSPTGEELGRIEEIMLDADENRIAYAVLSFGGFLGMGNKLFAIPWERLQLDPANERFVLDVPREQLEEAPGFDKDDWPDFADRSLGGRIHDYYGVARYW